jgi:hypothetical protein
MFWKLLWAVPFVVGLTAVGSEAGPRRAPVSTPQQTQPSKTQPGKRPPARPPKKTTAPELDPRAAGTALALLLGGAWALSERRRRGPQKG